MRRTATPLLALVVLLAGATETFGQDAPPPIVEVRLRDGSVIYGTVVADNRAQLVLRAVGGAEITVSRDQVKSIKATAGEIVEGEFWADDALETKLFLGPTGRALKRGEGYFAIDSLFLPAMQVGVTDRFSVGFGAPFYFLARAFYVTPKLQVYERDNFAVATGVVHLSVKDFGIGGFAYVAATKGTPDNAVTFGGAWIYARDDDGDGGGAPMFMIGGEHRIGRRSKLVTENYVSRSGVIASIGTRIVGQIFSFETGAFIFITPVGILPPGPFFNFIWHSRPRTSLALTPNTPRPWGWR